MTQNMIYKKAYAKVNLVLDVTGVRDNGYHDVRMVMQNLDLYDELRFEVVDEPLPEAVRYSINIESNVTGIPTDERNLIYKAVKLLFDEYDISSTINIYLEKNIPVEAGMAGGSTDAAAALHAVNELYSLGLSVDRLMELGVKLGADVPFCVLGRTALSEGIGEILTEIPCLPPCHVLVAKPAVGVSTAMVYKALDSKPIEQHPDVDGMVEAMRQQRLDAVAQLMGNVLERVTIPMHPVIDDIKNAMLEHGALNAMMSGSGPTVYGIYEGEEDAQAALRAIEKMQLADKLYVTRPIG